MNPSDTTTSSLPAWHASLVSSLKAHHEDREALYVQLATMQKHPANRTVVFRGFFRNTTALMIATDCRSSKVKEIKAHPYGVLCWYFRNAREQYRISGTIRIIDAACGDKNDADARQEVWIQLSDSVREQFNWPEPGGIPPETISFPPVLDSPPDSFCILVLKPEQVDYLNLGFSPHRRIIYKLLPDGSWSERQVNP